MSEPLAYFLTWTTYGTWLPGDERGWVEDGEPGIKAADTDRKQQAQSLMTDPPVILSPAQRQIVTETIEAHCRIRGWTLHAVNARTTHVHVILTAANVLPEEAMRQLKAWCSRRLSEATGEKRRWWTEHGSTKWINDDAYFHEAVDYVLNRQ